MRSALVLAFVLAVPIVVAACGAPPAASPTPAPSGSASASVASSSAPAASSITLPVTVAPPVGAKLSATIPIPAGTEPLGPDFSSDGRSVVFAAGGKLHRFDVAALAVIDARSIGKPEKLGASALVLHGIGGGFAAFDLTTAARIGVDVPKGYDCQGESFSDDASKVARNCTTKTDEFAIVQDTRTGVVVAKLSEFQTAAPVREATITASGNFIFWSARASGAFEEIKSKVTGPVTSSHSMMAPDERALFTVTDKNWMPDDRTPAKVLDPKTGRAKYTLSWDIERVFFSPDGSRFAALHAPKEDRKIASVTIHRTDDGVAVATLPLHDIDTVAFSPDAHSFVARGGGSLALYINSP